MAIPAPALAPIEYVRIFDLPSASSLPNELQGCVLFSRANFIRAEQSVATTGGTGVNTCSNRLGSELQVGASNKPGTALADSGRGKSAKAGFNYSKALRAALDGAGSSVNSRGDGKFRDGKDFAVSDAPGGRAKLVHLTPDALAPGNAERTLQQLDQLQQTAGRRQSGGPAAGPAAAPGARPGAHSRSVGQQHAAALAAAANVLYDISDEDAGGSAASASASGGSSSGGGPSRATATSAAAAATTAGTGATRPCEAPPPLRTPEYELRELPPDGPTGQGHGGLELSIQLPDVAAPGEVDVWLGAGGMLQLSVPGRYQLQLKLPYPVLDDTSQAKWSKAKRRLTLTLSRER